MSRLYDIVEPKAGTPYITAHHNGELRLVGYLDDFSPDVRRRLVDCLNACEGINPAAIPKLLELVKDAREELRLLHSDGGAVYDQTLTMRMDVVIAQAEGCPDGN